MDARGYTKIVKTYVIFEENEIMLISIYCNY